MGTLRPLLHPYPPTPQTHTTSRLPLSTRCLHQLVPWATDSHPFPQCLPHGRVRMDTASSASQTSCCMCCPPRASPSREAGCSCTLPRPKAGDRGDVPPVCSGRFQVVSLPPSAKLLLCPAQQLWQLHLSVSATPTATRTLAPAIILEVFHIHVKAPSNTLGSVPLPPGRSRPPHLPTLTAAPRPVPPPERLLCCPTLWPPAPGPRSHPPSHHPVLCPSLCSQHEQHSPPASRRPSPPLGSIPAPGRGLSSGLHLSSPASPLVLSHPYGNSAT